MLGLQACVLTPSLRGDEDRMQSFVCVRQALYHMSTFPALTLASPLRQGRSLGQQPAAEAQSLIGILWNQTIGRVRLEGQIVHGEPVWGGHLGQRGGSPAPFPVSCSTQHPSH